MKIKTIFTEEWFKPEDSDGAEFLLKPLSQLELLSVRAKRDPVTNSLTADGYLYAFHLSIQDWRGVFNDDGEKLPFDESLFPHIKEIVMHQIITKILQISQLSEEEEKN